MVSVSGTAFAADSIPTLDRNKEIVDQLQSLDLSSLEIDWLLSLETARINRGNLPVSLYAAGFPSNPKEGDTYVKTTFISKSTLSTFGGGLAGLIAGMVIKGITFRCGVSSREYAFRATQR